MEIVGKRNFAKMKKVLHLEINIKHAFSVSRFSSRTRRVTNNTDADQEEGQRYLQHVVFIEIREASLSAILCFSFYGFWN